LDAQSLIDATAAIAPDANGTQTLGAGSQVIRAAGAGTPITLLITPYQNLGLEILSAWDFEVVEIFETSRLGHGDWGTFTATWNETYMADVDVALLPVQKHTPASKRRTVVGKFGGGFQGTNGGGSFTHNRWYASLFYDGPSGTWMQGLDGGFVVHYIGQYWDDPSLQPQAHKGPGHNWNGSRKVREWVTLDLIINYTFNLPPPAAQSEVAGYSKDGGKNVKMAGKD